MTQYDTDTVMVTVIVDDIHPTIDSPSDVNMGEGDTGVSIVWSPYDLHPASYFIYGNGTQIRTNSWNSSDETITQSLDGLTLGAYNFTIRVLDVDANAASDTVYVTVIDVTAPVVNSPDDIDLTEG